MRVAAIFDIHANLPALEAVLEQIHEAEVDHVVVGGDVLPGPMPRQTIECLLALDLPVQFIRGNGDREVLARMQGTETGGVPEKFRPVIDWTARQLQPEHEQLLASWPSTLQLQIPGLGGVLFCHATPRNDTEIFTSVTPEDRLQPVFTGITTPVIVCGHTHMQFDRPMGAIRILNAGSVGMPFGQAGADWLLLGPDVQFMHAPYDLAQAAARVRHTAYPQAEDFAEHNILRPPSQKDMLAAFSRAELR
ncbi:MAG TPA: metallophosphoesterase family protein [Terriglobales bacterium]|nr:metallophosphoesterase family protein [Terriglobales bacterium]